MTPNEEVYKQLSEEFKLSRKQIEEACLSQFGLVVQMLESGEMQPIRLPYFGLWRCKPLRVAKLKELKRI